METETIRNAVGFVRSMPVAKRFASCQRRMSSFSRISAEGKACVGSRLPSQAPHLFLHGLEAVALVGACVTGYLARKRREELQVVNDRLRMINEQLRSKGSIEGTIAEFGADIEAAIQEEAVRKAGAEQLKANLSALEQSLRAPSASHPIEGTEEDVQGRTEMYACLKTGKEALTSKNPERALQSLTRAYELAEQLGEQMAQAISILKSCLPIMEGMEEQNVAIDIYGEIADAYTEVGDMQRAAEYYDYFLKEIDEL